MLKSRKEKTPEQLLWGGSSSLCAEIVRMALEHLDWPADDPRWFWMLWRPLPGHQDFNAQQQADSCECFKLILARCGPHHTAGDYGQTMESGWTVPARSICGSELPQCRAAIYRSFPYAERSDLAERSNSAISGRRLFSAQARGVAHGSASASTGSAPRARNSLTISTRPHRHAHSSSVLLRRSSRTSKRAPASSKMVASWTPTP